MTLDLIQLLVGAGIITGMWRLTREVARLTQAMTYTARQGDDHEDRIRALEGRVPRGKTRVR